METYNDIWLAVLDYCKGQISETGYTLWIETIKFIGIENNKIVLDFSSEVKKKIVKEQYGELLERAFENVMGFKLDIYF